MFWLKEKHIDKKEAVFLKRGNVMIIFIWN